MSNPHTVKIELPYSVVVSLTETAENLLGMEEDGAFTEMNDEDRATLMENVASLDVDVQRLRAAAGD